MVAMILFAAICLGVWFFVIRRESRDKLRTIFDMAARVIREEIKHKENR